MKIYIFERIEKCTPNCHEQGGVVVIAKDKRQVYKLLSEHKHEYSVEFKTEISQEEFDVAKVYKVEATEPKVYIFRDSGCC